MKYELIDKYTIKQIKHCVRNMIIDGTTYSNIETSNPTDEILDNLNIGMYLDESALIPEYNSSTHYLKVNYNVINGKIVKGYEVLEIVPSEQDKLKDKIETMDSTIKEMLADILPTLETMIGG